MSSQGNSAVYCLLLSGINCTLPALGFELFWLPVLESGDKLFSQSNTFRHRLLFRFREGTDYGADRVRPEEVLVRDPVREKVFSVPLGIYQGM